MRRGGLHPATPPPTSASGCSISGRGSDSSSGSGSLSISGVLRIPAPLKPIADQVIRSASSVAANLAEGQGRSGRDRAQFWRIAYGSAKEVDTHLRLLAASGAIDPSEAAIALDGFDQLRAMTWRLLYPKA